MTKFLHYCDTLTKNKQKEISKNWLDAVLSKLGRQGLPILFLRRVGETKAGAACLLSGLPRSMSTQTVGTDGANSRCGTPALSCDEVLRVSFEWNALTPFAADGREV